MMSPLYKNRNEFELAYYDFDVGIDLNLPQNNVNRTSKTMCCYPTISVNLRMFYHQHCALFIDKYYELDY